MEKGRLTGSSELSQSEAGGGLARVQVWGATNPGELSMLPCQSPSRRVEERGRADGRTSQTDEAALQMLFARGNEMQQGRQRDARVRERFQSVTVPSRALAVSPGMLCVEEGVVFRETNSAGVTWKGIDKRLGAVCQTELISLYGYAQ